jgi:hypothetical protein
VSSSEKRLIVLAGAGGAAALVAIGVVVVGVRALSGDSAAAPASPSGEGAAIASDGMSAPGTSALRALGCDPAIVIDLGRLLGDSGAVRPGEPRYVVTCDVPGTAAPTCDRAAQTYFGAVGASAVGNVDLRVSRPGGAAPLCAHLYAPSGALIR